jgi:hypothetical protein
MKAAVLGYGPAGLIAAKTLVDEGIDVDVIGAGGKSVVGGAQYLHENVMNPHHTDPEGYIEFLKVGDRYNYARKIYGRDGIDVSWDHYEGSQPAWALGPVYDILWSHFEDKLVHDTFNGLSLSMLLETGMYDIVFSSIPAHALCLHPSSHGFPKVPILLVPFSPVKVNNLVLYSGRESDAWYRTSCIFGEQWTEFGAAASSKAQYFDAALTGGTDLSPGDYHECDDGRIIEPVRGFKPLGTNCDCHPDMVRIGRFGLWDRKILLHHVPDQVRAGLEERT